MVTITDVTGTNVFKVSRGAFDGIYSRQGYSIVSEKKKVSEEEVKVKQPTEEELFVMDLEEKPISQWNKTEVKKYAELKNIDITGTKNANEAKEIIKDALESEE